MMECENTSSGPQSSQLFLRNGKIYDTEKLIDILSSDPQAGTKQNGKVTNKETKSATVTKKTVNDSTLSKKRRVAQNHTEIQIGSKQIKSTGKLNETKNVAKENNKAKKSEGMKKKIVNDIKKIHDNKDEKLKKLKSKNIGKICKKSSETSKKIIKKKTISMKIVNLENLLEQKNEVDQTERNNNKTETENTKNLKADSEDISKQRECVLRFANIGEFQFCCACEKFPERAKARIIYGKEIHTVKVSTDDSRTVKNLTDLTGTKSSFLEINMCKVEDIFLENCIPFTFKVRSALAEFHELLQFNVVNQTKPDIRFETSQPVIDLTEVDSNDSPLALISEKECANEILPIIHKFHKFYQITKKIEGAVSEISHLNQESEKNDEYDLHILHKKTKTMGYDLIEKLADKNMKNLDICRFLEIVVYKLEQKYRASVTSFLVAFYLNAMLKKNQSHCVNHLTQELLLKTNTFLETTKVKLENEIPIVRSSEVFSEEQLGQLRLQILLYIEISKRQEILLTHDYCDIGQNSPVSNSSQSTVGYNNYPGADLEIKTEPVSRRLID